MTGRELILYILQNNLENEQVFGDDRLNIFLTDKEAAVKYEVGVATIHAMYVCDILKGFTIGDTLYIVPVEKGALQSALSPVEKGDDK